jgi:hypothetical protein
MTERLKSKLIKCEFCQKDVFARGLQSHIRLLHSQDLHKGYKNTGQLSLTTILRELDKVDKIIKQLREQILIKSNFTELPVKSQIEASAKKIGRPRVKKYQPQSTDDDSTEQMKLF